jgi:hypothetical protein
MQVSAGHLTEAEPSELGGPGFDVSRVTASVAYHRELREGGFWASTAAWGTNVEPDHASSALLLETNVTLADRHTWFGRFELVGKSAHDLQVPGDRTFAVGKLQGGYTRYFPAWHGLNPGVGVSASAGFIPSALGEAYGQRVSPGIGVFATLRPAIMIPHLHEGKN